jgi:glycosyltransferase involved in cell wall biosynthesis
MAGRQRIICVMGRPLDQNDGIGIYTAQLLRNMLAIDSTTRYVILLSTPKHEHMFDEFPNAEIQIVPSNSKAWWDQVSVPRAARRARADLIFNPKFSVPVFCAIPTVLVLHSSDWFVNPANYSKADNLYIRLMLPIYYARATRALSISRTVRDDSVKYLHIDPAKTTVTFAAAAPHFTIVSDRSALRAFAQRYRLPDKFILTVARAYHTGLAGLPEYPGGNNQRLLAGYRNYRAAGGVLPLVVVGREIERYLRAHGLDDQALEGVHFIGFIPNAEMVYAYNLAEFFVVATLYESFCLPLIEALASGCPAIAPITGACQEVAEGAARYLDPLDPDSIGSAMSAVAGSAELRQQMRAAGIERAKEFSWQKTAQRTLAVLDSIVPP